MFDECGPVITGDLTNEVTFEPELKDSGEENLVAT